MMVGFSHSLLAQPGAQFCWEDEWIGEGERFQARGFVWDIWFTHPENDLGQSREDMIRKIKVSLERLPTAHLRIINEGVKIVVGEKCRGGASRKCNPDRTNAAIMLSYESFRPINVSPRRYDCDGVRRTDGGGWDEEKQTYGTILHEIGHHIDYHYEITRGLLRHELDDFQRCIDTDGCYSKTASSRGTVEVVAQAYYKYFDRTTYQEVLAGSPDGVPRHGTHPEASNNPNVLFNQRRLNVLLSSDAWVDWN